MTDVLWVLPRKYQSALKLATLAALLIPTLGCGPSIDAKTLNESQRVIQDISGGGGMVSVHLAVYRREKMQHASRVVENSSRVSEFDRSIVVLAYLAPDEAGATLLFGAVWLESGNTVTRVTIEDANGDIVAEGGFVGAADLPSLVRGAAAKVLLDGQKGENTDGSDPHSPRNTLRFHAIQPLDNSERLRATLITSDGYRTPPIEVFVAKHAILKPDTDQK